MQVRNGRWFYFRGEWCAPAKQLQKPLHAPGSLQWLPHSLVLRHRLLTRGLARRRAAGRAQARVQGAEAGAGCGAAGTAAGAALDARHCMPLLMPAALVIPLAKPCIVIFVKARWGCACASASHRHPWSARSPGGGGGKDSAEKRCTEGRKAVLKIGSQQRQSIRSESWRRFVGQAGGPAPPPILKGYRASAPF